MAATGKQLKQSVNVFHSRILYRLLPGEAGRVGEREREREREVCRGVPMMSLIAMEEKTLVSSI